MFNYLFKISNTLYQILDGWNCLIILAGTFLALLPWNLPVQTTTSKTVSLATIRSLPSWKAWLVKFWAPNHLSTGRIIREIISRLELGSPTNEAVKKTITRQLRQHSQQTWGAIKAVHPDEEYALFSLDVAIRYSTLLGAPLVELLKLSADSIEKSKETKAAQRVAMASPKTSARILMLLPLAGIALGMFLGVDPLQAFTDGGLGSVSALIGILFWCFGWGWTHQIIRSAKVKIC